ncbi:MAG: glutamate 5-kinase [Gammaproteobacteria bacterium]|nr:glutamate 5-kinase [Gammaproteobacteria bacterium]
MFLKNTIAQAKRLVIKIGSALLVNQITGAINYPWLEALIADVVTCVQRGQQIAIVSSGSIAIGRHQLKLSNTSLTLEEKQAAAAVGQIQLAQVYQEILAQHQLKVAQILLTLDDSENRRRYLNAKNTLEKLLSLNVIPIINENDTVATAEIRYGDNDRLAARVAQMVGADTLVLLSDIDGFYNADPKLHPAAQLIPVVQQLTPDIIKLAGDSITEVGSGGMITKLLAAKISMACGCKMVISNGKAFHPLQNIDLQDKKTWFIPDSNPLSARKNWLKNHLKPKGRIKIDHGAVLALRQGKSLLAAGIVLVEGEFHKGDAVEVISPQAEALARGLINYNSYEATRLIGHNSESIEKVLGYKGSQEIIHRNDLVLL